ncbi:hypothetical protein FH972_022678 [Carpinus fangiana]|uniref:J domain-containing protein n=1 Tax=Carpinus fangiana TaxID=176857 RepID=A0A5N6KSX8_9ROSI|nr:hypothetical protein FH972_022678 [Carpinus fangiana]
MHVLQPLLRIIVPLMLLLSTPICISRKPSVLLSTYNSLPISQQCSGQTPSSQSTRPSRCPYSPPPRQKRRLYATVQADSNASHDSSTPNDLAWPDTGNPSRHPTPYQIFNLAPSAPYSKRRFYDLVKLYHPDRTSTSSSSSPPTEIHTLPHGERLSQHDLLERYRLVIAAHNILSNHDKRAAYDRFGHGWTTVRDTSPSAQSAVDQGLWSTVHRWRTQGPQWPNTEDDPMYNATWEDWERWYARRRQREWARYRATSGAASGGWPGYFTAGGDGPPRQGTIFASNYVFLSVVALLAALGGIGQATRAHAGAQQRIERSRLVSEENSRMLMQARQDATAAYGEGEGKRERIKRFLKEREQYEGDFDGRALRAEDEALCAPKGVSERGEEPFWKKPPETR